MSTTRKLTPEEIKDLTEKGILPGILLRRMYHNDQTFYFNSWNDAYYSTEYGGVIKARISNSKDSHALLSYNGSDYVKPVSQKSLLNQIKELYPHLPIGAQELLIFRCNEQDIKCLDSFNYYITSEGYTFWKQLLDDKNIDTYYHFYPRDQAVKVIPEDIRRRLERNRIKLQYCSDAYYKFMWRSSEEGSDFWYLVHKGLYDAARRLLSVNKETITNQSISNGEFKVQRPVATISRGKGSAGAAIQGRRGPATIAVRPISNKAVIGQ